MNNIYKFIISLMIISILLALLFFCGMGFFIHKKLELAMEVQKISGFPTVQMCIGAKGEPRFELDGDKDYSWYSNFTNLKDQKYLSDKKIYIWTAPWAHYIIVVADKESGKVCFVTFHNM